ncbi:hypothetical protein MNEG_10779 [Monoraphidium neglectum]|uniref:Uncharacterized protein n=1 Tax=Monoraphidium neglectum TaxID=145388 RepID=A0A0D2MRL6_9CHLO|nr:hypothetical protein MNEG_10779 [Monoraphidium neglectum]KIY97185.1 hypothetical protein MNEG_10779 [Monoraphidium neglectum]|eukprot:XP_013896205.1 hypothetical protein MNEG_10779 [Monoraphidium neglectum]
MDADGAGKIKCVEYMVVDVMLQANTPLRISERIQDPDEFLGLTDAIVLEVRNSTDPALARAAATAQRIERRDVYAFCAEIEVPQERVMAWEKMTEDEVVGHQEHNCGVMLTADDVRVHNLKIDFSMGGENPVRKVPIWHRDGRWEYCCERPFEPKLCVQRKVRVYLARETADRSSRNAAIRAVQAAFAAAVKARFGSSIRIILGGERQPAAPSRSGVTGRSGGGGGGGGGGGAAGLSLSRQQASPAGGWGQRKRLGSEALGLEGINQQQQHQQQASNGGEHLSTCQQRWRGQQQQQERPQPTSSTGPTLVSGPSHGWPRQDGAAHAVAATAEGRGAGATATPEKAPPAKRRGDSDDEDQQDEQAAKRPSGYAKQQPLQQQRRLSRGPIQGQQQDGEQQRSDDELRAFGSIEAEGLNEVEEESEGDGEEGMLLTQESASAAAGKRRK